MGPILLRALRAQDMPLTLVPLPPGTYLDTMMADLVTLAPRIRQGRGQSR